MKIGMVYVDFLIYLNWKLVLDIVYLNVITTAMFDC